LADPRDRAKGPSNGGPVAGMATQSSCCTAAPDRAGAANAASGKPSHAASGACGRHCSPPPAADAPSADMAVAPRACISTTLIPVTSGSSWGHIAVLRLPRFFSKSTSACFSARTATAKSKPDWSSAHHRARSFGVRR